MTAWPGAKTWHYVDEGLFGDFNTYVRDALDHLYNAPLVMVRRTTNIAIPTQPSGLYVPWDTEDEDPYGFHAAGSTDLVIPAGLDGLYVVATATQVAPSAGAGNLLSCNMLVNALGVIGDGYVIGSDGATWPSPDTGNLRIATLYPFAAGDSVSVQVLQDSGANKNLLATGVGNNTPIVFGMVRVAP